MVLRHLDIRMQTNEVGSLPHTIWKTNSEWIKDQNVVTKTLKLLEENTDVNICDLGLVNHFLDMILKAQATKEKNK